MSEGKYARLIKFEPLDKSSHTAVLHPMIRYKGKEYANADFTYSLTYVTQPFTMIKEPHKHDFDQFVAFMGGNPTDFQDFDAEIEFYIEGEKYIIDKTATIHVPKGTIHGPLHYKRVGKPLLFLDMTITGSYVKLPTDK